MIITAIAALVLSIVVVCFVPALAGFFGYIFAFFLACGIPGALLYGLIHGEVSYSADRADERQWDADEAEDDRAFLHEMAEDERTDRIVYRLGDKRNPIYHDNRQVHLHQHIGGSDEKELKLRSRRREEI